MILHDLISGAPADAIAIMAPGRKPLSYRGLIEQLDATAAALASAPQSSAVPAVPVRQARAMVVIMKAARIGAAEAAPEESVKRLSWLRDRDGTSQRVPLIEFL